MTDEPVPHGLAAGASTDPLQEPSVKEGVELLRYPHPFRAAIAVQNDTDSMTMASFRDLHDFVNGVGETSYGPGLGLEMSDSFWLWHSTEHMRGSPIISLYHGSPFDDEPVLRPETSVLAEYHRLGWLDTLHSFGVWASRESITREHVARGLELLERQGFAASAYTNHSGLWNHHNVGGPWGYYQHGDDPAHPAYCIDLLRSAGMRWYWCDAMYELDKFGDHHTWPVAQEEAATRRAYGVSHWLRKRVSVEVDEAIDAFPGLGEEDRDRIVRRMFNATLAPLYAPDGVPTWYFKRYRGREGPTGGNFALQISSDRLDALEAHQGAVVIYQHFGVWRALGTPKGHPSRSSVQTRVLDEHAVWAFRELATRQEEGRLFVTTVGRLLHYLWMRETVEWDVTTESDAVVITCTAINCPVDGRREPEADELQGLSWRVPADTQKVVVTVGADRRELPVVRDGDVVKVEWRRLEYPML